MEQSQRWDQIKELFAECVELPAGDRTAFLDAKCADDVELRKEIDSLLAAHEADHNLLENHSIDLEARVMKLEPALAERRFGNYRIVREIGSGGMGSVFLAERDDGEFSMQVALKIVRQSVASSEVIERFKSERQILANLHHTNIATLVDGGVSAQGEPFLVMEFVDGLSITEYCDRQNLSVKERLRLFLKVCAAVSFAHRNLIVHRDLKPSNILVDQDGQPKLLDFGLAKAFTDDAAQTQTAFRAFTPAYASPEQILGRNISTASDQYSLGVLLYELLTGSKPFNFDGRSYDEIVRSLETSDVRSPSTIVHGEKRSLKPLAKDLDNITLKALRREPERRYGSVDAFADDIRRHLEGRPVSARPNTFSYLGSRFIKRYRTPVAAAAFVLLALIGGFAVAVWQAQIARQERDKAEQRFQEVRRLSTSFLFEIAPRIERLQGSTETREILVTRALEYLNTLAAEKGNDPELQLELAQAYQKVGDLQGNPAKPNLGNYLGAVDSYEKAREILTTLESGRENKLKIAKIAHELSNIRFAQGQTSLSINESQNAHSIYKSLLESEPESTEILLLFLAQQIDHAHIYSINNQYELAIPMYESALARLNSMDQSERSTARLTALGTAYLSNSLSWDSRQAEAEAENEKAVAKAELLRARYPRDPEIQRTVFNVYQLASSTFEGIKNEVSLSFAEKAVSAAQTAVDIDPADLQAQLFLAKSRSRLGISFALNKRVDEAISQLTEAERALRSLIDREPRNTIYLDDLGTLYIRFGDVEKARNNLPATLAAYQKAAEICERMVGIDERNLVAQRDLAQALKSVGVTENKLGMKAEARASLSRASTIVKMLRENNALGDFDEKIFTEMDELLAKI